MFEVEPNLWLQSFASPALNWLMLSITTLGYDWFYIALIVVLGFGVRLRPTLGVMLALLLAGLVTHAAKTGFEMPRPSNVDVRVLDEGEAHAPLVGHGGADGFFALPSPEARTAIRALPDPDYGFISGHVAAATAMCLGLWWFFRIRSRAVRTALIAWPLLMIASRMYLGRHFLGDALGGLMAGISMAALAIWLLPDRASEQISRRRLEWLAGTTGLLCLLAPFTSLIDLSTLGRLGGLVLVLYALTRRGFPDNGGRLPHRAARIGCVALIYAAIEIVIGRLQGATGLNDDSLAWLPVTILATATLLLGGVALGRRLRLFGRQDRLARTAMDADGA